MKPDKFNSLYGLCIFRFIVTFYEFMDIVEDLTRQQ